MERDGVVVLHSANIEVVRLEGVLCRQLGYFINSLGIPSSFHFVLSKWEESNKPSGLSIDVVVPFLAHELAIDLSQVLVPEHISKTQSDRLSRLPPSFIFILTFLPNSEPALNDYGEHVNWFTLLNEAVTVLKLHDFEDQEHVRLGYYK